MNEIDKPKKCGEPGCNNKVYKKDYWTAIQYMWVCRKHYYMYSYGYSEHEASQK